jgi:hypothetical protein
VLLSSAIVTALDVDRHARDVRNEQMATMKEREEAQQVAGVLRGIGERASWTVREATDEEARRLATMVDLKIADIRAVDADAYGGFVADAAIRSVAHKTREDWRTVLRAWRGPDTLRGLEWSFPLGSHSLNGRGRAAAGLMTPLGEDLTTVFDLKPCEGLRS